MSPMSPARSRSTAQDLRQAVEKIADWVVGRTDTTPPRAEVAAAVRHSLSVLEQLAPGQAVEIRVPPFAAAQVLTGVTHTRGTPANVVEATPLAWLRIIAGIDALAGSSEVSLSGVRAADIARFLPLVRL